MTHGTTTERQVSSLVCAGLQDSSPWTEALPHPQILYNDQLRGQSRSVMNAYSLPILEFISDSNL